MLHKLENSGLPIYRDDETGKLALEAPLTYKGFAKRIVISTVFSLNISYLTIVILLI